MSVVLDKLTVDVDEPQPLEPNKLRAYGFLQEYIKDCEEKNTGRTVCCTPKFLLFRTGSPYVSVMRATKSITVAFHRDPRAVYPMANTCIGQLTLPTCHTSYENFKDMFNKAIEVEGQGFMII